MSGLEVVRAASFKCVMVAPTVETQGNYPFVQYWDVRI